jgi:hypothetical protein
LKEKAMPLKFEKFDASKVVYGLNKFSLCNVQTGLFPTGNKRATTSNASQSRSESCIAINPKNPNNMVGSSKKFINPATYLFKLGVIYTFDAGNHWNESSLPMKQGWDGMTDPAMAFDDFGNAFLIGEPLKFHPDKVGTSDDLEGLGMVAYKSTDGGVTWGNPIQLTTDTHDDKQWVVCDNSPTSPHYGNVYAAWGASSPLRFARSTDHGQTWKGKGNEAPGTSLVSSSFSPEMSVSNDGTLHILWHNDGSTEIRYLRSTDGGNSFEPVKVVVSGIESLRGNLPLTAQWPHFDYGKFRVITLVTDCVASNNILIVAWADMREGRSRIYYRRSLDNGVTWEGPPSGQTLLPNVSYGDTHCFHPQIIATGTGVIGCAFYTFGQEFPQQYRIRVQLAASWDDGETFSYFITVTDQPWDPLVNAPAVHGNPNIHFIGEYFGLDAGDEEFALLWTDTRTGVQELWSDVVQTKKVKCPRIPELVAEVFGGVSSDGGGFVIINGKFIRVPPRSPLIKVLDTVVAIEALSGISEREQGRLRELRIGALRSAVRLLEAEIEQLSGGKKQPTLNAADAEQATSKKTASKKRGKKRPSD